jgi:sugar fermentation stimulation protein A
LLRRPNRFIFEGTVNGSRQRLHCPVTGLIGGICDFAGIPCLISPAQNPAGRTTAGTVEAISLNGGEDWIGINQTRINGWVEILLRADALPMLIPCAGASVEHEVRVEHSRLDFRIRSGEKVTYLELKTPTRDFFLGGERHFTRPSSQAFFDRLVRHHEDLAELARRGNRTIVAVCFMYDAAPFPYRSFPRTEWNGRIHDALQMAQKAGVESYQINFKITPSELRVIGLYSPTGELKIPN